MVQVLEDNSRPSFGTQLASGIEQLIPGIQQFAEAHKLEKQTQLENEKIKQLTGMDVSGLQPQIKQKFLEQFAQGQNQRNLELLKQQGKKEQEQQDIELQEKDYSNLKNIFGQKFADTWKSMTIGGKTKLVEAAIDTSQRGGKISDLLKSFSPETEEPTIEPAEKPLNNKLPPHHIPDELPQMTNGKIPKNFEWPNFSERPKDYTPKDFIKLKGEWRKENVPIFNDNSSRLANTKNDILATKSLNKLNETRKVGEDFEASLINPETGDFYGPAQALGLISPEGQQWVKEIARFQNRAKDAFGSRVTNFDLQSYMKQFPGLLNSYEGRRRILRMMDLNYRMDKLHASALDEVYKHYKLDGIPLEAADEIAQKMIKNEIEKLNNEYLELDEQNKFIQPRLQENKMQQDRTKRLDELT